MRKHYFWKLKHRDIPLGERTVLMGVLNLTPDSFRTAASTPIPIAPLRAPWNWKRRERTSSISVRSRRSPARRASRPRRNCGG
ncbi:MAG: hypothetical protein WDO73_15395 [Ignavibacteriota bacterium]